MPQPSAYAPHEDLLAQVDFFIERAEESLAGDKLDLASQARLLKDAHTLAMLGLVLSRHDAEFPQKAAMPALVKAAQALAAADGDRDKSEAALADLKSARQGKAAADTEPLKWQPVASLPMVMKQVPLIHASLKRGTGKRLARNQEQVAAQAAALAAIAQASMFDEEYASTPEDVAAWQQFCAEMRDAAGEVNVAAHAGDADRVESSMTKMLQSCEACHEKFR
jgi:cytochrome c556